MPFSFSLRAEKQGVGETGGKTLYCSVKSFNSFIILLSEYIISVVRAFKLVLQVEDVYEKSINLTGILDRTGDVQYLQIQQ